MLKVMVAPDSFKGTLSAVEVARYIEKGIRRVVPEAVVVTLPLADGGEGTLEAVHHALGGDFIDLEVSGPFLERIPGRYGLIDSGQRAVVEMAAAAGLILAGERKNPMKTTTLGLGEMILDALDRGVRDFYIGIGGSATNDGGIGMARALGVRFLDGRGREISLDGEGLGDLVTIDMSGLDPRVGEARFVVICDVDNPLYGENGAAHVYGPQKGATPEMVAILDENLRNFARVVQKDLACDVTTLRGGGAAGGLGAGLVVFLKADLVQGIDLVLEMYRFEEALEDVDLIITGEGRLDRQSLRGKVPMGVAAAGKRASKPVIAIAGEIGRDIEGLYGEGITAVFSTNPRLQNFQEARTRAGEHLEEVTENIMRLFLAK